MSLFRITVMLGLLLLVSIVMAAPVFADGYETIFSGWVDGGKILQENGCYLNFTTTSNCSVHLFVQSPNYPSSEVNLFEGHSYNYYDALRIYLVDADLSTNKALVDISKAASSGGSAGGTRLYCDVPGQNALGGDVVSFPVTIQNNDRDDRIYDLSASSPSGWSAWYNMGDKSVYKINVPGMQSRTVNLMVQTSGNTPVGEKKVTASIDGQNIDVYVHITSINQSVEVSAKVGSKIASIGDKIYYDFHLKNLQSKDNLYRLSVTGLPENWYYRFKESTGSMEEMAEVIVPSSSFKDLVLEIVPPYSVGVGDYNFTATMTAPDGTNVSNGLNLLLKSGTDMSVTTSKLAYDAKPGESFNIDLYVANSGRGSALTNVYPEAKAPEGWMVQVSPNRTNSIKAGDLQKFTINVVPPGNIVASDYEVNVKIFCDQAEKEKDYRVTIKTESYIPYIGGAIIIVVLVGLVFMYRKFGRR